MKHSIPLCALAAISTPLIFLACSSDSESPNGSGGDGSETGGRSGTETGGSANTGGRRGGAGGTGGATGSGGGASTGGASTGGSTSGSGGAAPGTRRACDGTPPTGIQLNEVASGLTEPTFVTSDPTDASRLYVTEKTGDVHRVGLSSPLTTINVNSSSEAGVLGMAFHPDFGTGGESRVFVSYSAPNLDNEIQVFSLAGDTMTPMGPPLYSSPQAQANHNGGDIAFGPDGYLYLGIGDGGAQNDGDGNAQDLTNAMGSIVRIDVDNPSTPPSGNLSAGGSNDTNIVHWGFRNPWRLSFDSALGDLYIADVGQDAREEVSVVPPGTPGSNFGWPALEGTIPCTACRNNKPPVSPDMVGPAYEHEHVDGNNAITGGYVYRGSAIPSLVGRYILSDSGSSNIYTFTYDGTEGCDVFDITDDVDPMGLLSSVSSFGQDADGELYVVSIGNGRIFRLESE